MKFASLALLGAAAATSSIEDKLELILAENEVGEYFETLIAEEEVGQHFERLIQKPELLNQLVNIDA